MQPLSANNAGDQHSAIAFSLIELLIVIAIISILAAMLLPALAGGKERARRTACASSMRQLALAVHLYGDENGQHVLSGAGNYPKDYLQDDHLPIISDNTSNEFVRLLGHERMVHCPSFTDYFVKKKRTWDESGYGYIIGYNYHGGHTGTPWPPLTNGWTWISPMRLTDNPGLVLFSDMNDWSPPYGQTYSPHGKNGPILSGGDFANTGANGASSAAVGAAGGNVGLLDGSVSWKKASLMRIYCGSHLWGKDGCWAMW